ncbi:hypothetical protein Clacol_008997 [Clathrus columnatus]|uniref:Nucleoporin Nup54 alpha-helical domain-containing protein n=1 Tax=Clathrus columnatus TaxID=1419009 RepID=A0AAV5AK16_9AGAM|nr:hypothetical protein Clacol_008997 [Clathrus columnatus]
MSSLFGGTKPSIFGNAPSTGFGSNNANQNPASSIFGTPQQPAGNSSSFGAGNTSGTTPGLFGNNPPTLTNNPSPFSQSLNTNASNAPPPTFGNPTATTGTTGTTGLLGNTGGMTSNTSTTGLFSNTSNTGTTGLFGNTTNNTGTGLFGNTNPNTNTNPGTGLFGNTNTNQASTSNPIGAPGSESNSNPSGAGLFGNTAGASTTSGGLFGNQGGTNVGTNSTLFGNTGVNSNTTTNSLFGGNTAGATGTSVFGQSQQQPPQQTQPQQPANSLFGSSTLGQLANQNQSLFGSQNNANKFGSSVFSSSALGTQPTTSTNFFGQRPAFSSTPTSTFPANSQPDVQQRIEAIVAAWDPSSPQCRFQHFFYNLVDPRQIGSYGRPSNATDDALWNQAIRENPDPTWYILFYISRMCSHRDVSMVPVLAVGFDDLQKRVDAQSAQAKQHTEKLKELQTRLNALAQTHVLSTTRRTTHAIQTHTLINHRLLRLVEHIHLLIPNLRSTAITPEEEALRANLERIREELSSGNGRGRLNELWALLGAVRAAKERDGSPEEVEWKVVDWDGLERLAAILGEQQQGLAHLTTVINNDLKDLEIMGGKSQNSLQESLHPNFFTSSSFRDSRR